MCVAYNCTTDINQCIRRVIANLSKSPGIARYVTSIGPKRPAVHLTFLYSVATESSSYERRRPGPRDHMIDLHMILQSSIIIHSLTSDNKLYFTDLRWRHRHRQVTGTYGTRDRRRHSAWSAADLTTCRPKWDHMLSNMEFRANWSIFVPILWVLNVNRPVLLPMIRPTVVAVSCTIKMLFWSIKSWNRSINNRFNHKNA